MTERQLKAYANRRQGVAVTPSRKHQTSKAWKARNPGWWKGRKYVQLLTSALVRGNPNSKVFKDAGMTWDEWFCGLSFEVLSNGTGPLAKALANGSKLVPIKSWREFDKDPDRVKAFLAPGNFKLVQK